MAAPDHTVLIRPFFAMDGAFSSPPSWPRIAATGEFTQRPLTPRDGMTEVADTLADLLADSEACLHTQCLGWPMEPSRWPFTSVYADGIGTEIRYPHQHAGMLGRLPE